MAQRIPYCLIRTQSQTAPEGGHHLFTNTAQFPSGVSFCCDEITFCVYTVPGHPGLMIHFYLCETGRSKEGAAPWEGGSNISLKQRQLQLAYPRPGRSLFLAGAGQLPICPQNSSFTLAGCSAGSTFLSLFAFWLPGKFTQLEGGYPGRR